ncbi:MAG: ribosome recycling factor [Clostridiales bacterium]|jgi:ribosome recycling factor|nr:ribosome recycling factor [Clostridiales bacterium]
MINELHEQVKSKMEKSIQVLKKDLARMRAGRANPQILDRITVDYYGVPTPLNQLGNITVPEARLLVISLWDSKMIPAVEREIMKSDLGITPTNDGKVIRLVFPELTEERRKELVKTVKKMGEETKVAIRKIRREANDQLRKMQKNSEITEDDLREEESNVQKITDDYIKKVDELIKEKENEIMEV